jgi:glycosyl hydrolase family 2
LVLVLDTPLEARLTEQVRSAFASGFSPETASIFLGARANGLGWEAATQAAADGLAQRYGVPARPSPAATPRMRLPLLLLGGLVAYVALRPVLGLGHELVVAALAWLFHAAVATGFWESIIRFIGLDPIYAGAAIRAAGGVQVVGLAVAGPIGAFLHALLPLVFLDPASVARNAAISMVASPGAPALGRGLAAFGADVAWLTFGLWLFWRWRRTRWPIAVIGALIQAQIGVNHLLAAHIRVADMDASGLPFALQVAMPNGGWVTSRLTGMPSGTRDLLIGGCLLVMAYAMAAVLLALVIAAGRLLRLRRSRLAVTAQPATPRRWSPALVSVGLALLTAWSPVGALAVGLSNWQVSVPTSNPGVQSIQSTRPGSRHTLRVSGATPVAIAHPTDSTWQYVVDGTAEEIRGVGYNPWYANLSPAQRSALYDRDFSDMHRLGINTIEGWFENQFDSVTLDAAARNGIGVLMPFELNQDWDYTNPNVTESILEHVTAYVDQYKDHPAVRMWAPGNENLHRVLYAHWVSQANNPQAVARAQAFANFLPILVDRIHQVDPNHPVLYRDAEDVYLPWITNAFAQAGGTRPWLVYGANIYSAARLQQVVSSWPIQWPGQPLLISEFAPGGMSPTDRPLGFQQQWNVIRSRPDVVLGGLAYTWATNGPEDLDRVFGLVDPNGVPTDGGLAALSSVYLSDTRLAQDAGGG